MRWGNLISGVVVTAVAVSTALAVGLQAGTPAHAAADARAFHGLPPARLVDTRSSGATVDGHSRALGALGADGVLRFTVAGRGGVPATGAASVALNVTATEPTAATFLTVYPATSARETASNLNALPGRTASNMVLVDVGSDGQVAVFNRFGSVHVVVDVLGWFPAGGFTGITPTRFADSRPGSTTFDGRSAGEGAWAAGATRSVPIAGRAGVPADAAAVAVNLTAVAPTENTYLTAYPAGAARPTASNVNAPPGTAVPNMVIVPLGGGSIDVFNARGRTDVLVDVLGYFAAGTPMTGLTPARLADTRVGEPTSDGRYSGYRAVGADGVFNVVVAGRGGVPADAGAVALNVTATAAGQASFLTVYPAGSARPIASNLNFVANQTVANIVVVPLGNNGQVSIYQRFGEAHVVVDVLAWFPNPTDPPTSYGNSAVLSATGIGAAAFGAAPSVTFDVLTAVYGAPYSDVTAGFPVLDASGDYTDGQGRYFDHPVGRQACWGEPDNATCATFGGATSSDVAFSGWYTYDSSARLFTAAGVGIGARPADLPGTIAYSEGGCYSSSDAEQADGLWVGLHSRGIWFMTVDGQGNWALQRPPESDVYVTYLSAGSHIYEMLDC